MKLDIGGVHLYDRPNSPYLWMQYCIDGVVYRESTRTADREKAEKIARRKRDQVGKAREDITLLPTAKQRKVKVSTLLDALELHLKVNAKAKGKGETLSPQDKSHIKPIRDAFGNRRAASLSEVDIENYIDKRQMEGKASATINNELGMLSLALSLARKNIGPGPEIKKLPVENARNELFEKYEIDALIPNLPEDLRDFVKFSFVTGMRKSEISSLRWKDYNPSTGVLTLSAQKSKNGKERPLPCVGELAEIISRRWKARSFEGPNGETCISDLIFFRNGGKPIRDFDKAWKTACEAAGLKAGRKVENGKIFHDLRRSAATFLERSGVPREVCKKVTGHLSNIMFERYRIIPEQDVAEGLIKRQEYVKNIPIVSNVVQFERAESK